MTDGDMHWKSICRHSVCPRTKSHGIYFAVHPFFFFLSSYNVLTEQYLEEGIS